MKWIILLLMLPMTYGYIENHYVDETVVKFYFDADEEYIESCLEMIEKHNLIGVKLIRIYDSWILDKYIGIEEGGRYYPVYSFIELYWGCNEETLEHELNHHWQEKLYKRMWHGTGTRVTIIDNYYFPTREGSIRGM